MQLCYPRDEVAWVIAATALGVFVSTIWTGSIFQGSPVTELGNRPLGSHLFAYLFRYYKDGVGVWGYDPVLGAFAPPLRTRFHLVVILVLWAGLLSHWPVSIIPDQCFSSGISLSHIQSGVLAMTCYLLLQYLIHYCLPGVSHPGGPRDHKIQRIPAWEDTTTTLPAFAKKWRCTVAEESHEISKAKFAGTAASLTGEASGRQMWTNQKEKDPTTDKIKVDEKLVMEMASGGRENSSFNPSRNPNRCVSS